MSKITKDQAEQVRMARLEGWRRMAQEMKNHHILSVELLRTRQDTTAAVFTVNRNGEVVQYIVRGDSQGRLEVGGKDPRDGGHEHHEHHHHHHHHHHHEHGHECGDDHGRHEHGHHEHGHEPGYAVQAQTAQAEPTTQLGQVRQAFMAMALAPAEDPADPNIIALGEPPPKQDPPPGIIAVGGVLLASAFDVGEQVPTSGSAPPK